jgi:hypothetical protein
VGVSQVYIVSDILFQFGIIHTEDKKIFVETLTEKHPGAKPIKLFTVVILQIFVIS